MNIFLKLFFFSFLRQEKQDKKSLLPRLIPTYAVLSTDWNYRLICPCCCFYIYRVSISVTSWTCSFSSHSSLRKIYRCFPEAAEKSYWFSSWRTVSCGCFLSPPFLFSITLPAMDLLQESPWAVSAEWLIAHHHPWFLPSEPACYDDEELEDRYRIPGL